MSPADPSAGAAALQHRFYNTAYGRGRRPTGGSRLYRWLTPFEVHRVDVAFALLRRGGRLLDVGCGNGALTVRASPYFDVVVGADLADPQIADTRRSIERLGNARVVQANLDAGLPFAGEQFDVVAAIALLAHLFDPEAGLRELRRVLRPSGQLVLEVPNLAFLPRRLTLLAGGLPQMSSCHGWGGGILHTFTRSTLCRLLEDEGFRVTRVTGSGIFAPLRTWWPSLLTGNLIVAAEKV